MYETTLGNILKDNDNEFNPMFKEFQNTDPNSFKLLQNVPVFQIHPVESNLSQITVKDG